MKGMPKFYGNSFFFRDIDRSKTENVIKKSTDNNKNVTRKKKTGRRKGRSIGLDKTPTARDDDYVPNKSTVIKSASIKSPIKLETKESQSDCKTPHRKKTNTV